MERTDTLHNPDYKINEPVVAVAGTTSGSGVFGTSFSSSPRMTEEIEIDEENINWTKLIARIIAILLLILIIICFSLGVLNQKLFILAGIIFVALAFVIIFSYIDIAACKSRYLVTISIFVNRKDNNLCTGLISGSNNESTETYRISQA